VDWTVIGAVGELVGAIGVIFSLLYLGRQIRSATRADQRVRYEGALAEITGWTESVAAEGQLADIVLRGMTSGMSALTPVERFRFNTSVARMFRGYELLSVYSAERGVAVWGKESFDEVFRDLLAFPGIQQHWSERKHWYAREMRAEIESLLMSPGHTLTTIYEDVAADGMRDAGAV